MLYPYRSSQHHSKKHPLMAGLLAIFCLAEINSAVCAEAKHYQLDTENSYIHIYTGTDGFMQTLSHKHLISLGEIRGHVSLNERNSVAELQVRPETFLVDNDTERQRAVDKEYQEPVADWIKISTKKNMNGSKLLEADIYPKIEIRIHVPELVENPVFLVEIKLKAKKFHIEVPGSLAISDRTIHATGDFTLSHSKLALKPFSVPGGLSSVADQLRFVFGIQAVNPAL